MTGIILYTINGETYIKPRFEGIVKNDMIWIWIFEYESTVSNQLA